MCNNMNIDLVMHDSSTPKEHHQSSSPAVLWPFPRGRSKKTLNAATVHNSKMKCHCTDAFKSCAYTYIYIYINPSKNRWNSPNAICAIPKSSPLWLTGLSSGSCILAGPANPVQIGVPNDRLAFAWRWFQNSQLGDFENHLL